MKEPSIFNFGSYFFARFFFAFFLGALAAMNLAAKVIKTRLLFSSMDIFECSKVSMEKTKKPLLLSLAGVSLCR